MTTFPHCQNSHHVAFAWTHLRHNGRMQQGSVLFTALIVLIAMSLAAVALIRAFDSSILAAGNVAFRQSTLQSADLAIEEARSWLLTNSAGTGLENNSPANGYFAWAAATEPGLPDSTTRWQSYPWDQPVYAKSITDTKGNQISYVIQRLCSGVGSPNSGSNNCISGESTGRLSDAENSRRSDARPIVGGTYYYYRVTVRAVGPRQTQSFSQSILEL
ncbi:MAG: hypothetical protein ABI905_05515 [Betaproteobacteria bacterium]